MKKLILIMIIGISQCLYSEHIESFSDLCSIHEACLVGNEQANTHFSRREYLIALENYQRVIQCIKINNLEDPSNLLHAICGSMFCYDLLNQDEFAKSAFDELVCEIALLEDRIEKIDWFRESPIYSEFKYANCYKTQYHLLGLQEATPEENCQLQCNGYAVAAAFACGRIPHLPLQFACYGCIFGLEQLCVRCCKGQGFWENCVKGLRRLFHDPEHPENPAPHPYE